MRRDASQHQPCESGGVLLGYKIGRAIVVTEVIGGGPAAMRTRHTFKPNGEWQATQVARRYAASGDTITYLGDWHSHPGSAATPSRQDRRTARHIARSREARCKHPLFVILNDGAEGWQPHAFVLDGRTFGPQHIELFVNLQS